VSNFRVDVFHHFVSSHPSGDLAALSERLDRIMVTTVEGTAAVKAMTATVDALNTRIAKIGTETAASLAKIVELSNREDLPAELEAALGELASSIGRADAAAKGVDEQVPDAG
jgi:hypothetical protein